MILARLPLRVLINQAAKALGLNKIQIFFKVMGPQILRHALPGIGNVWQITLKDTSLISVTGLVEIMRQTRIASNVEHSPLTFLITSSMSLVFLLPNCDIKPDCLFY